MMFQAIRTTSLLVFVAVLSACSSTPDHPEITELFATTISGNGSKFFSYTVIRSEANSRPPQARGYGMKGRGNGGGKRQGGKMGGGGRSGLRKLIDLEQGLAAILDNNQYCREGYMVLERLQHSIRGECHEAATEGDRQRFINRRNKSIAVGDIKI